MTVWWITLFSTYFLCLFARMSGKYKYVKGEKVFRANALFAGMACAVLIFVSGFRENVGDTGTYRQIISKLGTNIIAYLKNPTVKDDTGFYAIAVFIRQFISTDTQVFLIITAIITIGAIFICYYKNSNMLELVMLLFITTGCYEVSMNGVRQYLASAILFFSFPLIHERKWKIYIPLVLLCSTIHQSALIFLILYFFADQPAWGHVTKWILFIGVILFITYPISGPMIANLLGQTQYGNYKDSLMSTGQGANIIRVMVMAVPVVLSYVGRDFLKGKEKYLNIVVNFSVLNLIFILLATKFWIYARFNMYFIVYMILLLEWCIEHMFDERNRKIIYICCILLYCIYFYYEMHISIGYGDGYHHFIRSIGINI
jgi:transmembrane protein EpsG